jgi:hypothetical protein
MTLATAFDAVHPGPGDGRIPPTEVAASRRAADRFDGGVTRSRHLGAD